MRCALILLMASFVAGTACQPAVDQGPVADQSAPDDGDRTQVETGSSSTPSDFVVGSPIRYANLTVFPVSSVAARMQDRFLTLDEGLKAGMVEITELAAAGPDASETTSPAQTEGRQPESTDPFGDDPLRDATPNRPQQSGGEAVDDPFDEPAAGQCNVQTAQTRQANDVNRLAVLNKSDRPLYLMPGEIIVGGQQDRVIGQELVIAPGSRPVPIDVYCVEQGRWARRGQAATRELLQAAASTELLAKSVAVYGLSSDVAKEADEGKFIASVGNLSQAARRVVQKAVTAEEGPSAQAEVWENVARENARRGVHSDSNAYTANYASRDSVQELDAYVARLERAVAETNQVVGAIVAINGKVETLDLFESTPLFHKLWPKLLKSYALDAANAAGAKNAGATCSPDAAREFLVDTLTSAERDATVKGNVALSRRESERVEAFSAHDRSALEGQGGGFGNFGGGAVHSSGFSK
jgi:hypothetical protein